MLFEIFLIAIVVQDVVVTVSCVRDARVAGRTVLFVVGERLVRHSILSNRARFADDVIIYAT